MRVLDCAQRSDLWVHARLGRVNASRAADLLAVLKNGSEAASRRDLRVQLVLETLTGCSQENGYQNADMLRGLELEPQAIAAYEAHTGTLVEPVGYVMHDTMLAGASPDGFVGDDGLIEVKAPRPANHLATLRANAVPKEYVPQLTHQLWVTERRWADYTSYSPVFPEPLRLVVIRHHRDELDILSYSLAVTLFLSEVERELEAVQALMQATV